MSVCLYPYLCKAPYCLRPLWLHRIFTHYLTNVIIFEKKKVTENKMCAHART